MTAQAATAMQPIKGNTPVAVRPGDLLEQFDSVYDSIAERAFELFQRDGGWSGNDLGNWLRAEAELLHPAHMELTESDGEFTVRAEVPGFSAKDLEIRVEPRNVRIAGKREIKQERNGRKVHSEWSADQILRVVNLPTDVDTAKVSANVRDGILTIELPKAPHAKAIRIEPKSA
jgi:HSP20 family protein